MSERFFSSEPITGDRATLTGAEAHHLLHVLRAKAGERVTLFDGSGAEFDAEVTVCHRATAELEIIARREVDRELPFSLSVGVALPKGDRQKWLVEKLVELGTSTLVPLVTERSVAEPTDAALERLRRAVIEASKQCGRNRLMEIAGPEAWNDWIAQLGWLGSSVSEPPALRRLLAHRGSTPLGELDLAERMNTALAVGPEGGFTDDEVQRAVEGGWRTVDLGPRTLRVETAAVALVACVAVRGSAP